MSRLLLNNVNLIRLLALYVLLGKIINKLIIFRISRLYGYYSRTVTICSRCYIYNTAPSTTKEETLTINWVGYYVGIVISEIVDSTQWTREQAKRRPRARLPFIYLTHKSNVLAQWQSKRLTSKSVHWLLKWLLFKPVLLNRHKKSPYCEVQAIL